eukprot:8700495-Lingulodinium_polyedra.AAC.1
MSGEDSNVAAVNAVASGSEDSQARGPRAAARARASWQFVLTDNRNFPDVRMRIKTRWMGVGDLG